MTDLRSKRKWAGAPINEKRKIDARDKRHLSPHQKPREYSLVVEWTETVTWRRERKFTTQAALNEAMTRIERHFRETAQEQAKVKPRLLRSSWLDRRSPFADFTDQRIHVVKEGPRYIETVNV